MKGLVFAIEEMAVHDGPGLRAAIFLKGCPLRCRWCHNPEGWEMRPQRVKSPNGCLHCGACETSCAANCTACGKCLPNCPRGLIRISGKWWTSEALAAKIHENDAMLMDGGVTISGGEPLMQAEFLIDLLGGLSPLHRAIETSGYGREDDWQKVIERLEFAYFDIKLAEDKRHREYTGVSNAPILRNLDILKKSGLPFVIRIPCMAGVNDDMENLTATRDLLLDAKALKGVELLPYNTYAGAKYALIGREYEYAFEKPSESALENARRVFSESGIPFTIR